MGGGGVNTGSAWTIKKKEGGRAIKEKRKKTVTQRDVQDWVSATAAVAEVSLLHLRNSRSHIVPRADPPHPVTPPSASTEDFPATPRSLLVADGEDGYSPAALFALTLWISAQSKSRQNLLVVHFYIID